MRRWLDALVAATSDLADLSLGFPEARVSSYCERIPHDRPGAFIALRGDRAALRVGVLYAPAEGEQIARAFLSVDHHEGLSGEDLADAMREIVNILAGGVKQRMAEDDPSLLLGLPEIHLLAPAPVAPPETALARVRLGPVDAHLIVIGDTGRGPV